MTALVAAVAMTAGVVVGPGATTDAGAQPRRVVVVGDSIVLGAEGPLRAAFGASGWEFGFDAQVSRTTADGAEIVGVRRGELTDSLVVGLGANDAGNPATFRARVRAVLDAAAGVPHVYWLSLAEVRNEYPPANQILREEIAGRPGVVVIDWATRAAADPGLTAGDGLHLSPSGAAAMASLVHEAVLTGGAPLPPPPPHVAGAPSTSAAPTAARSAPAAATTAHTAAHDRGAADHHDHHDRSAVPVPVASTGVGQPVSRATVAAGSVGVSDVGRTVGGGLAALVLAWCSPGSRWSVVARRPGGRRLPERRSTRRTRTDPNSMQIENLSACIAGSARRH